MERLLTEDRNVLRPIMRAILERNRKIERDARLRVGELTGDYFPVDAKQERLEQIVFEPQVEICLDYLLGATTFDEQTSALTKIIMEAIKSFPEFAEDLETLKEVGEDTLRVDVHRISLGFTCIMMQADTEREWLVGGINMAVRIAPFYEVAPKEMFRDDKLYAELVRSLCAPESFRNMIQRRFMDVFDADKLFDNVVCPMIQLLGDLEGKSKEEIEDMKNEAQEDSSWRLMLEQQKNAFSRYLDELVQGYFG